MVVVVVVHGALDVVEDDGVEQLAVYCLNNVDFPQSPHPNSNMWIGFRSSVVAAVVLAVVVFNRALVRGVIGTIDVQRERNICVFLFFSFLPWWRMITPKAGQFLYVRIMTENHLLCEKQ